MRNLQVQMSTPDNPVLNVRMATNFPKNEIIANPPPPPYQKEHVIRPGKTVMVFSGKDSEAIADAAALSYRVAALRRTSMCNVFGSQKFALRFEEQLPSGSILFSVSGNQGSEEKRQELYSIFAADDPFIYIFENLLKSDYSLVARRAFHSSFAMIMTLVSEEKTQVFEKISSLVFMTEMEKAKLSWTEKDRSRLITVIHEGVDVSEEFYEWFDTLSGGNNRPVKSVDATGFVEGVTGNA